MLKDNVLFRIVCADAIFSPEHWRPPPTHRPGPSHPPQVFTEFLYTLDAPLLVREKELQDPEQFAGPGATDLQLLLLVYTQQVDLLSVVQVKFALSGATVRATATVSHYPALPTDVWLQKYLLMVCSYFRVV